MKAASNKYSPILISIALAAAALLAFEPVRHNSFIDLDDNVYVSDNEYVKNGITGQSVLWAFTKSRSANWHPLTWLSHMLDCRLFGLNPAGHHLTSLLLHIANTLLLFLALQSMTGAVWRSAFVAAAFALHPLHVESVAWVAERKDVLSGFFWMLTIIAYTYYVKHPNLWRYLLTLLVLLLGLMSKPMVVTLPFVLFLLDYWPLGRFSNERLSKLILEKVPFLALAAAAGITAFLIQQKEGALPNIDLLPVKFRIANALISYVSYIAKTFWPSRLAVFYPYPTDTVPIWQAVFSFLLLLGVSILIIKLAKNHRYLPVGWLWYLGTLVPVIGLVQAGSQAMADRYTYLPLIGVFIITVWGADELFSKWRLRTSIPGTLALIIFIAMMTLTRTQVKYWRDSITLFEYTLKVTDNNHTIHNAVGASLLSAGKLDEAIEHLRKALELYPDYAQAHYNLANAVRLQGKLDEAIIHYRQALRVKPNDAWIHNNLGTALQAVGKLEEAVQHYQQALQIEPDLAATHTNFGGALLIQGKPDEAIIHLRRSLRLNPENAETYHNLGVASSAKGNLEEAVGYYRQALKIKPDDADTYYNLSIALKMQGNSRQAVAAAQKALDLAVAAKNNELADKIRTQLQLYKQTKP